MILASHFSFLLLCSLLWPNQSLEALGLSKLPRVAIELLMKVKVLPRHFDIQLATSGLRQDFMADVIQDADRLLEGELIDQDKVCQMWMPK